MYKIPYTQKKMGGFLILGFSAVIWFSLNYIHSVVRPLHVESSPSLENARIVLNVLQWMVIVLAVGTASVLWRRSFRWNFGAVRQELRDIRHLNLYQVCELVGEAFHYQGWKIHNNVGAELEDGPDLVLRKERDQSFIWCRFWRLRVTEEMVQEVITWGETYRAPSKIISLRTPTAAAKILAENKNIEWIGLDKILEWKRSMAR